MPSKTKTQHYVGFWFLEALQNRFGFSLVNEKKFFGIVGQFVHEGRQIRVVAPTTFMNLSGQSVGAMATFYRIPPEQILVAHDELDLEPGTVRLKSGGGHGGHNGLRDIIPRVGSPKFTRRRIGIGHPGHARAVSGYVLSNPSTDDRILIDQKIDQAIQWLPEILSGDTQKAMNALHTKAER